MTINIQNRNYHYTVKYSKRKSIGLSMTAPNELLIRAPFRTPIAFIESLLMTKANWLHRSSIDLEQRIHKDRVLEHQYIDGEMFYYFGEPVYLKIHIQDSLKKAIVSVENGYLIVKCHDSSKKAIHQAIEHYYKTKARAFAEPLIHQYANALGVSVFNISFKNQSTRWGSCSSKGNINLNLRLAMMPPVAFQYIIVHEMAHLIHMNHSKDFWNLVATMCPDYKAIQLWIKDHSQHFKLN